jgi:hypothetical protein
MTLIEVLLAVVILGTALGALVEAASRALAVVRQARNYEQARRMLGRVDAENPLRLIEEIKAGQERGSSRAGRRAGAGSASSRISARRTSSRRACSS